MILFQWDRWPRPLRHLAIQALGALLGWAAQEGLPAAGPWLAEHQPLGPLVGVLLGQLVLIATPLVRYADQGNPPPPGPGIRASSAPVLLLLAVGVLALVAASSAPARAAGPERRGAPSVFPEITSGLGGCGDDNRTVLGVRMLAVHGSTLSEVRAPIGAVRVEFWFDEGWQTPAVARWDSTHVVAAWRTMHWRAYLEDGRGRRLATGPAYDVPGDSCAQLVDSAPALAKVA